MRILTSLEDLRDCSPLGTVVHECLTRFNDITWAERRHELIARGMAECAYWLSPWQVDEYDGISLYDFRNAVFHREAYCGIRAVYLGLRQRLTIPTPDMNLQLADEWRDNPAFQARVTKMIGLLEESLDGFNIQLVLQWLSHGVHRTPDHLPGEPVTQRPTGLFDAVTRESLREWHQVIDSLGYSLGTRQTGLIAAAYSELMTDVSVSKQLRGVFGISQKLYGSMGVGLHRARVEDHIDFDVCDLPEHEDPNGVIQTKGGVYMRRGAL